MLRLVAATLTVIAFGIIPALADAPTGMPIEATWLSNGADALAHAGPYGVIIILGFVVKALWQTIENRDIVISSLQEKRADAAAASSKLLAEVATTGSATVAANTTAQAELTNRMQGFADLVRPLSGENARILAALDRNAVKIDEAAAKAGTGCRA